MKRGQSGLSLLIGVKKPVGMSSHDVVNRCRRIFGERRVGHTGTLDPLASGVLPILVGPATRLDAYMVGHEKEYLVDIRFGWETNTDDGEGEPTRMADVPPHLDDEEFACSYLASLVGAHEQVPPAYSAIKVNGQTAYKLARAGKGAELEARTIEVLASELHSINRDDAGNLVWTAAFCVSKGTYIRALARDIGRDLGSAAHVARLERTRAGRIPLEQCVSLDALEALRDQAALDPVRILGVRYAFGDMIAAKVANGGILFLEELDLFEPLSADSGDEQCACTTAICRSAEPPEDGELIAVVTENRLRALYRYDARRAAYKSDCVFSVPVSRQ